MKIHSVTLHNFRGYCGDTTVMFQDLTAFVGRNDIGKSTILEALDIFFNDGKGIIKIDKLDLNTAAKKQSDSEIRITVRFSDLPKDVVLDSSFVTHLDDEYLLNPEGLLEVTKKYANGGSAKVFLHALHPTNPACSELLLKKDKDLRGIIESKGIYCENKSNNPDMRKAIWTHYADDLRLKPVELEFTKGEGKSIWERLQKYLPIYSLFQADRKNSDGDSEIQDPLREAVKMILKDDILRQTLDQVAQTVLEKLQSTSDRTLAKLRTMDAEVAATLVPVIPSSENLKWADVFKNVSISGDENIPINKRGSGVKRMILLSFFQAEVERLQEEGDAENVIYAIEEPETSQHFGNQKKLVRTLSDLAEGKNVQVIITTHSATVVKALNTSNIRIVREEDGRKTVGNVPPSRLPYASLNEVNYLAFGEATTEYHDELYGYLKECNQFKAFADTQPKIPYVYWDSKKKATNTWMICLTDYIRHQIHHPENTHNTFYSEEQLAESIRLMRDFIETLP